MKKPKPEPAQTSRPLGYFLELVVAHNWPPGFTPTTCVANEASEFERRRIASKSRETQLKNGHNGSIRGLSTKADERMDSLSRKKRGIVHK